MEDQTTKTTNRRAQIDYLLDTATPAVDGRPEDTAKAQVLALLEIADGIDYLSDVIETMARWFSDSSNRRP